MRQARACSLNVSLRIYPASYPIRSPCVDLSGCCKPSFKLHIEFKNLPPHTSSLPPHTSVSVQHILDSNRLFCPSRILGNIAPGLARIKSGLIKLQHESLPQWRVHTYALWGRRSQCSSKVHHQPLPTLSRFHINLSCSYNQGSASSVLYHIPPMPSMNSTACRKTPISKMNRTQSLSPDISVDDKPKVSRNHGACNPCKSAKTRVGQPLLDYGPVANSLISVTEVLLAVHVSERSGSLEFVSTATKQRRFVSRNVSRSRK